MAVRLREADNIAAMAELQQQISELEIQVKSPAWSSCLIELRYCSPPLQTTLTNQRKPPSAAGTQPGLLLFASFREKKKIVC